MPIENKTDFLGENKSRTRHLENILALISNEEIREKNPTFEIEPETVEWARRYAEVFLKRLNEEGDRWKNQERNNFIGMIGHKCFELTLQQLEIPYAPNDPILDWRTTKNYDFRIPFIGKIEVKTADWPENHIRILIKKREWHGSQYAFGIKVLNEKPTQARFYGYATKEEVEGNSNTQYDFEDALEGTAPWSINDACYWKPLSELHPASEFFHMLQTKTAKCWKSVFDLSKYISKTSGT